MKIVPYTDAHIEQVIAFNRRLKSHGVFFQFPEHPTPKWLPKIDGRTIYQEYFVAVEENNTIRGGYILKHQDFFIDGQKISIGNYQLPLSEGTINNNYNRLGLQMLLDALRRQPLLYALGMGGLSRPLPQLLKAVGWRLHPVPFYFKVIKTNNFLKNITYLRNRSGRKLLCDFAALTGIGALLIKSYQVIKGCTAFSNPAKYSIESDFGEWSQDLWENSGHFYSCTASRDKETLNIIYPKDDQRFLQVKADSAGWAIILDTKMQNHKQFGNMRVGSIVDCFANPDNAIDVISAAIKLLKERGVDIIISNQIHHQWCDALSSNGFIEGPSNFALATSPVLTDMIFKIDLNFERLHFNRGDGDGPINL